MHEIMVRGGRGGGAYRDHWSSAFGCKRCGVSLLEREEHGDLSRSLSRSMLVRDRSKSHGCTACMSTMEKLTLTWDVTVVELEECGRCGRVLLDKGELERIRDMLSDAAMSGFATDDDFARSFGQMVHYISEADVAGR